jgi:hypothetical protein
MSPAFTKANKHLFNEKIMAWNLPAGHSCPAALECLAKADKETGRLTKGKDQLFKCYAAVTERFPSVRSRVWCNFDAVRGKGTNEIFEVISTALPIKAKIVRIHAGGDFFSQAYFDAWIMLANSRPEVTFYAYTKSVQYWVARLNTIPDNLMLNASFGGIFDHLIDQHQLKYAKVVWSEQEAQDLGLQIDTDDRLAAYGSESFALLENFSALPAYMKKIKALEVINVTQTA